MKRLQLQNMPCHGGKCVVTASCCVSDKPLTRRVWNLQRSLVWCKLASSCQNSHLGCEVFLLCVTLAVTHVTVSQVIIVIQIWHQRSSKQQHCEKLRSWWGLYTCITCSQEANADTTYTVHDIIGQAFGALHLSHAREATLMLDTMNMRRQVTGIPPTVGLLMAVCSLHP